MAAAEKIKALIKSFADNDEARFYSIAMQIAASEARKGHSKVAEDLKKLIETVKKESKISSAARIVQHPAMKELREVQDLVDIVEHTRRLKDMVLNHEVRESLDRIIREQKKFDELRQYNLRPRRKLLLTGPPGCGKTMSSEALASELDIPFYTIRLDGLISRYMGESITKLKVIFDYMNHHRAVYLFDEFDSIGSHRYYGNDVGEIKRVLNSFLLNIENDRSNSLIIAATNMPDALDKALFRRFDDIITFPLPDEKEIEKLLVRNLKHHPGFERSEIAKLSKKAIGLSFADIARACEEAIKEMVVQEKQEISLPLIEEFIKRRQSLTKK